MGQSQRDQEYIKNAIEWAKQDPDIPADITPQDCVIRPRILRQQTKENPPTIVTQTEWTVIIRDRWAVDLDGFGRPKGPPRRL
jgi:hypothetical protein